MSAEYWEPHQFVVGERVRIRLSLECRTLFVDSLSGATIEHIPMSDGCIGTICEIEPDDEGHDYFVRVDEGFRHEGAYWRGGDFAAAELEPLAATPADAPSRGRGAE